MPIYTKTGDGGETGLFGNQRVPKDDPRIEAYGTVDELNSCVGVVRAEGLPSEVSGWLAEIQSTLFDLGADLATPGGKASVARVEQGTRALERWIDQMTALLPELRSFVLPGGHRESALCHVARTVCRRAERAFWALYRRESVPPALGVYLNRLSDFLFVLGRDANRRHGVADTPWTRG